MSGAMRMSLTLGETILI